MRFFRLGWKHSRPFRPQATRSPNSPSSQDRKKWQLGGNSRRWPLFSPSKEHPPPAPLPCPFFALSGPAQPDAHYMDGDFGAAEICQPTLGQGSWLAYPAWSRVHSACFLRSNQALPPFVFSPPRRHSGGNSRPGPFVFLALSAPSIS